MSNNNLLRLGVCYYSIVWFILNNVDQILYLQKMMVPKFAVDIVDIPEFRAGITDHNPCKETMSCTLTKGDCN